MECERCRQDFEAARGRSMQWMAFNRDTQNLTKNTRGSNLVRETRSGIMPVEIFLCDGCFRDEQQSIVKRNGWVLAASIIAMALYIIVFFNAIKAEFGKSSAFPVILIPVFVFFSAGGLALGFIIQYRSGKAAYRLTQKFLRRKLPSLQRNAFASVEEHQQFVRQSRAF